MTSEKSDYPIFDGKDFADWKFRLELTLAERELLDHVRKEPKVEQLLLDNWVKVDVKAKNVIVKSLGREHSHIVRSEKSAHGMLKALSEVFEKSGAVQERHLRMKLNKMKCEEGQPLDVHFAAFDSVVMDLRAAGAAMTETEQVTHLLMSLPRSYEHIVTVLLAMEELTLRKAKARLLNEEVRRSEMNEEEPTGRAAFLGAPKKFTGKCWRCNEPGHRAFECPKASGEEARNTEKRRPGPQKRAFNLSKREDDRGQEEDTSRAFAFMTKRPLRVTTNLKVRLKQVHQKQLNAKQPRAKRTRARQTREEQTREEQTRAEQTREEQTYKKQTREKQKRARQDVAKKK
ncbi:hypothetical protein pipiens_004765 [Culex pipiens pipiens]|uniref:CCHC-type domain-containing protein n=1 Tax=Culex pipiens pipiens TaxID=38569 RepID=A0ABD1CF58_CULPP